MKKKSVIIFLVIIIAFMGLKVFSNRPDTSNALNTDKTVEIIIDPGHGGNDPGTMSKSGIYEKDINLEVGKMLHKELLNRGYGVRMTRDEDIYLKSMERVNIANLEEAKVFISLHCNAVEKDDNVEGIQILHYPSDSSKGLSETLLGPILKEARMNNMGLVERKDLIVLNQTSMPATIVEMGFLTNSSEARKLNKSSYQWRLVKGIADGIEGYLSNIGGSDEKER